MPRQGKRTTQLSGWKQQEVQESKHPPNRPERHAATQRGHDAKAYNTGSEFSASSGLPAPGLGDSALGVEPRHRAHKGSENLLARLQAHGELHLCRDLRLRKTAC